MADVGRETGHYYSFFLQLRDVAGEFGIYDAATVQRMQPAGFLWLDTLRSREGLTSLETPSDWL